MPTSVHMHLSTLSVGSHCSAGVQDAVAQVCFAPVVSGDAVCVATRVVKPAAVPGSEALRADRHDRTEYPRIELLHASVVVYRAIMLRLLPLSQPGVCAGGCV
jgi:hypothetical protein